MRNVLRSFDLRRPLIYSWRQSQQSSYALRRRPTAIIIRSQNHVTVSRLRPFRQTHCVIGFLEAESEVSSTVCLGPRQED